MKLLLLSFFCIFNVYAKPLSCADSKHESNKLAWVQLSRVDFDSKIPVPIPGGLLCGGFAKDHKLMQVSYKSKEGSLRVFNRKFFLGRKRTVITSSDFVKMGKKTKDIPILSFSIFGDKNDYKINIEHILKANPFTLFF